METLLVTPSLVLKSSLDNNVNYNLDTVCTGELSHASCQQTTSKYWPRINLARTNMNWDEHSVKKTPWVEISIHINKTED